jgi:carboxyl-terminal processing protease
VGLVTLTAAMACQTISRVAPVGSTPSPAPQPTSDSSVGRHLRVFETAWTAVRDQYVREDYDGADWEVVGETYRARIESGLAEEAFAQTMRDMLAELPEGKAIFQTRAERLEQETADATQYQGIGAFIAFRDRPQPHVVILSVIRDSPAEQAGLRPHDSIYAIDGVPVQASEAETVAQRIRGPAETSVTLTVAGPDGTRRELTIPRGRITATDLLRGGRIPSLGVAYYRVPVVADAEMTALIADNLASQAESGELNGIILDLRVAHSGGQGWPLISMLTLFGNGPLGEFYTRTTTETLAVNGQDIGGSQTAPLVILIGPDTEGSAEVFAAALSGAGRAVVVGMPTPGEVEGFSEVPLPDGSRMFLATSSFRTLDGLDLAHTGLAPDVRVDGDWDVITNEDDPVLEAALALLAPG